MDRLIHLLARKNGYMDLIRYIETAALTQVLDTIHQLTGQPLLTQILGYGNIQSDCQATFISDQPTRDILRDDLYIRTLQNGLLSIAFFKEASMVELLEVMRVYPSSP